MPVSQSKMQAITALISKRNFRVMRSPFLIIRMISMRKTWGQCTTDQHYHCHQPRDCRLKSTTTKTLMNQGKNQCNFFITFILNEMSCHLSVRVVIVGSFDHPDCSILKIRNFNKGASSSMYLKMIKTTASRYKYLSVTASLLYR